MEIAQLVLNNPKIMGSLIAIAFDVDNPISSRACWVMEYTAKENLSILYPHLDLITSKLGSVYLDSSVRPIAKICECLLTVYYSGRGENIRSVMNEEHLKRMTTACFDWLISEQKVAAKAYSMTCLYLLGKKFDWIHPELKMVITQNYASGSAAYKARARKIMAKLP
tara:strand:+ start:355 stop:855 length:501 start_codon:yes stop_codon:yes gene_type:complete